jgi:hypothetical protein
MNMFSVVCITGLFLVPAHPGFASNSAIRQITIQSQWRGLGRPQDTKVVIQSRDGSFYANGQEIDRSQVTALVTALNDPLIPKPSPENLGLTHDWLDARATEIVRDAKSREEDDSTYWMIGGGSPKQQALFKSSYTDEQFIARTLPELFRCCHTDDWPSVEVTVAYEDGASLLLSAHSQSQFMLPWKISDPSSKETFDRNISIAVAALLPKAATNRERLTGDYFPISLAGEVMTKIDGRWKLISAEEKCGNALAQIRRKYAVVAADVNTTHDVTFGVYSEKHGGVEENLHADVRKPNFPQGLSESAILLYSKGTVRGVDDFLQNAAQYEELVLSVPWLNRLLGKRPVWPITLMWVHDCSFSDKAMRQFANDMHKLHKDALANEVRNMRTKVAVLSVSYGDWWLVLPDRRMILWRYESVSGLLGLNRSKFSTQECTDYQGVTGGCVGAIVSPGGDLPS